MNDELHTAEIPEFIKYIIELLTRKPDEVQLTEHQMDACGRWLEITTNRHMGVRALRLVQQKYHTAVRMERERVAFERFSFEDTERVRREDREQEEQARLQEKEHTRQQQEELARREIERIYTERVREQEEITSQAKARQEMMRIFEEQKREQERSAIEQAQLAKEHEERTRLYVEQVREQEKRMQEERARQIEKPRITNQPHVNFMSFVGPGRTYLKFIKQEWSQNLSRKLDAEGIQYPIGVTYDEKANLWFICDRNIHKLMIFNIKTETVTSCEELRSPTAVMVYEEGKSVAVLCAFKNLHTIYAYDHTTPKPTIKAIVGHAEDSYDMRYKLRGLAKSAGGNIVSMETNMLRIFKRGAGGIAFQMEDTMNPCYLSTFRANVAVSDVVQNKVFIFSLDDRNWDNIHFNRLKVISTDSEIPMYKLCDQTGFKFVSGMQFDAVGNLMIADSKGHSMKLYDSSFNFVHRISSEFPLPYVSAFHITKDGECVLLDTKDPKVKLQRVKLTSGPALLSWVRPEYWGPKEFIDQKPRPGVNLKKKF